MSATLSKAKKPLTARWRALVPDLASAQPRFLVRRHGPLICGVCLDATMRPDAYVPRAFFHNLAMPFPVVSITAAAPARDARGVAMEVKVLDENAATAAARALLAAHPWLQGRRLTLDEVATHVADYVAGHFGGVVPFQVGPVELVLHACAWLGDAKLTRALREAVLAEMKQWPERAFNIIVSRDAWAERTSVLCEPGAAGALRATAQAEAERHRLASLPELPLELDTSPSLDRRFC